MKLKNVMEIIDQKVSFEKRESGLLKSDHFPDMHAGENLLKTKEEAWELAERFAKATGEDYVNIYVVDQTFSPVNGYAKKKLKAY